MEPNHDEARRLAEWYVKAGPAYSDPKGSPMNLARCYLDMVAERDTQGGKAAALELIVDMVWQEIGEEPPEDESRYTYDPLREKLKAERDKLKAEVQRRCLETIASRKAAGRAYDERDQVFAWLEERAREHPYRIITLEDIAAWRKQLKG